MLNKLAWANNSSYMRVQEAIMFYKSKAHLTLKTIALHNNRSAGHKSIKLRHHDLEDTLARSLQDLSTLQSLRNTQRTSCRIGRKQGLREPQSLNRKNHGFTFI
jgi:hypothetical protein